MGKAVLSGITMAREPLYLLLLLAVYKMPAAHAFACGSLRSPATSKLHATLGGVEPAPQTSNVALPMDRRVALMRAARAAALGPTIAWCGEPRSVWAERSFEEVCLY